MAQLWTQLAAMHYHIAVITCSEAEEACPVVFGAATRYTIPYDDPRAFDGTPEEEGRYAERRRQIAREMLYLFSDVMPVSQP